MDVDCSGTISTEQFNGIVCLRAFLHIILIMLKRKGISCILVTKLKGFHAYYYNAQGIPCIIVIMHEVFNNEKYWNHME